MRALVVGAAGFVGKYLLSELRKEGTDVFATKLPGEKAPDGVPFFDLDLRRFEGIKEVLQSVQPDRIFHLAAQSSVKLSWDNPALTTEVNAVGTVNLLEGVRLICPKARVLLVGSSEEYGSSAAGENIQERERLRPKNVYALTKCFQEELSRIYFQAYDFTLIMTRSFNHCGPGQARNFVVSDFCGQVADIEKGRAESVIKVGNLDTYRDFTDVRDVVRAYTLLAKEGRAGEVYNVGSGEAISIRSILEKILSFSEKKIEVRTDPNKFRPAEVQKISADVSKLRALGWERKFSIEETLFETLQFFRGNL